MRRGKQGWLATGGVALLLVGCGDPCVDDGFGMRDNCAAASGSADGSTSGVSSAGPAGDDDSADDGPTSNGDASASGDTTGGDPTDSDTTSGVVTVTATDGSTTGDTTDTGDTGDTGDTAVYCSDVDGDGFGDPDDCFDVDPLNPPMGTVPEVDATDCDDADDDTFPGAAVNEPALCATDADGDGWGDDSPGPGVDAGSDCDDTEANTFPGAAPNDDPLACLNDDDLDDWGDPMPAPGVGAGTDCDDGDGLVGPCDVTWCLDVDGDGFGDPTLCVPGTAGNPPTIDHVDNDLDCDDGNAAIFPGAGFNEAPPLNTLCMLDADGDGFGHEMPPGPGVAAGSDCDDGNAQTFPGAAELDAPVGACMNDDDMDGFGDDSPPPGVVAGIDCDDADPMVTMCELWCLDTDGDGFGDPLACMVAGGPPTPDHVNNFGDCDDNDANTFPGASPLETPPLDLACTTDVDGDDYGDTTPAVGVTVGTDCDDSDANIGPGAAQLEPALCAADLDGDGWGDWDPPPGVDPGSDCDDTNAAVERCALLVTQDGTAAHTLDAGLVTRLQNQGLTVLLGEDTVALPASAGPASIVVLSETANSPDLGAKWRDIAKPVIVLEGLVWDDMEMAPTPMTTSETQVLIVAPAHPIAAGLVGVQPLMLADPGSGMFRTAVPATATPIASRTANPAHVVVFAYAAGTGMLGGFVAPAARIGFGADVDAGAGANGQLGAAGLLMFEAAVAWALP